MSQQPSVLFKCATDGDIPKLLTFYREQDDLHMIYQFKEDDLRDWVKNKEMMIYIKDDDDEKPVIVAMRISYNKNAILDIIKTLNCVGEPLELKLNIIEFLAQPEAFSMYFGAILVDKRYRSSQLGHKFLEKCLYHILATHPRESFRYQYLYASFGIGHTDTFNQLWTAYITRFQNLLQYYYPGQRYLYHCFEGKRGVFTLIGNDNDYNDNDNHDYKFIKSKL